MGAVERNATKKGNSHKEAGKGTINEMPKNGFTGSLCVTFATSTSFRLGVDFSDPRLLYSCLANRKTLEARFLMQIPPVIPTMGSVGMAVLIGAMVIVALLIIRRRGEGLDGQ